MTEEAEDLYVLQLHQLFRSCDSHGDGLLSKDELVSLCNQLQLTSTQSWYMINRLIGNDPHIKIDFDEFKEVFVDLLTQDVCGDEDDVGVEDERDSTQGSLPVRKITQEEEQPEEVIPHQSQEKGQEVTESQVDDEARERRDHQRSLWDENLNQESRAKDDLETNLERKEHQRNSNNSDNNISGQTSVTDDSFDSVRDYIRSIWKQLNVGQNGYLKVNELYSVCLGIGMTDMTEDMVNQLFLTLDEDQDGRVSFDELLQGMFRQQQQNYQQQPYTVESNSPPKVSSVTHASHSGSTSFVTSIESTPQSSPLNDFLTRSKERRQIRERRRQSLRKSSKECLSQSQQMISNQSQDNVLEGEEEEEDVLVLVQAPKNAGFSSNSSSSSTTSCFDIVSNMNTIDMFSSSPRKVLLSSKSSPQVLSSGMSSEPNHHSSLPSSSSSFETTRVFAEDRNERILSNSFYLYSLDQEGKGSVEVDLVISLWESYGFSDARNILKEMGFESGRMLSIQKLSSILEEEISNFPKNGMTSKSCFNSSSSSKASSSSSSLGIDRRKEQLFQIALISLQNEFLFLKNNFGCLRDERNRLRVCVTEANLRADLLAQEIDEHHRQLEVSFHNKISALEKKHQEEIRALEEQVCLEREAFQTSIEAMHAKESSSSGKRTRLKSDHEEESSQNQEIELKKQLDQIRGLYV